MSKTIMKILFSLLLIFISSVSHASLICKSDAHGLSSTYSFSVIKGTKNLLLKTKTIISKNEILEYEGIATYSSTVMLELLGEKSEMESYYIFVPTKDSYTELIAISSDFKSVARSRPMPTSNSGNFIVFSCVGKI